MTSKPPVIAEMKLYQATPNGPKLHRIAVRAPERDPAPNGNYRCSVFISGDGWKHIYGIDSFQSLHLAMRYIRIQASSWIDAQRQLYFDRQLKHKFDIAQLLLDDFSKWESRATLGDKLEQSLNGSSIRKK